jgi:tetratricopeptide (TPR) repeat protein
MSRGEATAKKSIVALIASVWFFAGCGPTIPNVQPMEKKADTLPNDIDVLVAFAEARAFEDAQLPDLSAAADALDKALELAKFRKTSFDPPELLWRLSRVCFLASETQKGTADKLIWIARGEKAAEAALRDLPNRVEGYYYLAVLKGRRAQHSGIGFSAIQLAKNVEELGQKAVELDPRFEDGGPYRLLAMLYAHAPPWPTSIGDIDKAIEYADKAVGVADYPMNHLVRGEVLIEADEGVEARKELKLVLTAPKAGRWAHEGEIWRPYARQLLDRIDSGE